MPKPTHNRAAQFSPFAALRGYEDYVADARRITCPRRELCEDEQERLSAVLSSLGRGDTVRVTHYVTDSYELTEGKITDIDEVFKHLSIDRKRILFSDIIDIER